MSSTSGVEPVRRVRTVHTQRRCTLPTRDTEQGDGCSGVQELFPDGCVADFIRRLEKTFRVAYGREAITPETRNALLYGQLLLCRRWKHQLFQEQLTTPLCVWQPEARSRQAELSKWKQYQSPDVHQTSQFPVTCLILWNLDL